ncbi:MAG: anti-sigma factor [Actinomycetota bacterium]
MSHDPERDAAAYLGGVMAQKRTVAFESHLLECEQCWLEVSQGRRGRVLAESARELAPQSMREDVRATIAAYERPPSTRNYAVLLAAALAVAVVAALTMFVVLRTPPEPRAVAAAIADFRAARLPVLSPVTQRAPDLSKVGFHMTSDGSGKVGGMSVNAFMYEDAAGHRLLVYSSSHPFPKPNGATRSEGGTGPWIASDGDVRMICVWQPHPWMLIANQTSLLIRSAEAMGVW